MIEAENNPSVHRQLVNKIVSEGYDGAKAFYCATFSGESETEKDRETIRLKINTSRVLPVETW